MSRIVRVVLDTGTLVSDALRIGSVPHQALLGTGKRPGRGLPDRRLDEEVIRINFTPYFERTIQDYGVVIDDVHYYHDVLRPWINTPHPEYPKHKRKFRFHRDPRDISQLYFFDEIARRYYAIPYRDTSLPPAAVPGYNPDEVFPLDDDD